MNGCIARWGEIRRYTVALAYKDSAQTALKLIVIRAVSKSKIDMCGISLTHSLNRAADKSDGAAAEFCLQQAHPELRITLQKFIGTKLGSLFAMTSALTLPNVVWGLCLIPS